MKVDDRQLMELVVESQDLHKDSMRTMPLVVDELTDLHRAGEMRQAEQTDVEAYTLQRRTLIRNLGLGALVARGVLGGGFAATLAGIITMPVFGKERAGPEWTSPFCSARTTNIATPPHPLVKPVGHVTAISFTRHGCLTRSCAPVPSTSRSRFKT